MAITEEERFELFERAREVFGALMSLLPPVGWSDVATKHDLERLSVELRAEIRAELHQLRAEFYKEQRQQLTLFLTANAVLVSVIVTVVQLVAG